MAQIPEFNSLEDAENFKNELIDKQIAIQDQLGDSVDRYSEAGEPPPESHLVWRSKAKGSLRVVSGKIRAVKQWMRKRHDEENVVKWGPKGTHRRLVNAQSERNAEQSYKNRLLHAAIMAHNRLKEIYAQPDMSGKEWPEELQTLGQIIKDTQSYEQKYTED